MRLIIRAGPENRFSYLFLIFRYSGSIGSETRWVIYTFMWNHQSSITRILDRWVCYFSPKNYYYSTVNGGRMQKFHIGFISSSIGFFFLADTDDSVHQRKRGGLLYLFLPFPLTHEHYGIFYQFCI